MLVGLQPVDLSAAAHEVVVFRIAVHDGDASFGFVRLKAVVSRVNLRDEQAGLRQFVDARDQLAPTTWRRRSSGVGLNEANFPVSICVCKCCWNLRFACSMLHNLSRPS